MSGKHLADVCVACGRPIEDRGSRMPFVVTGARRAPRVPRDRMDERVVLLGCALGIVVWVAIVGAVLHFWH